MTDLTLRTARPLGRTGMMTNPLTLGTMTFGEGGWRAGEEQATRLFHRYRELGGWTFDTADVYAGGAAEDLLGRLIAEQRCRAEVVVATKASAPTGRGGGNAAGNGRKHLLDALHGSLRRLRTEYVDLFWLHLWDGVTPVEDVVATLDDMVRSGKARAVGLSNVPAWYAATALTLARLTHREPPAALQLEYSVLERGCERELVPFARSVGLSVAAWGPLAGGLLTGKYGLGGTDTGGDGNGGHCADRTGTGTRGAPTGRLTAEAAYPDRRHVSAVDRAVLTELLTLAEETGRPPAQLSLAWLAGQPTVDTVIVGATTTEQLESNVASLGVTLSDDQLRRLEPASGSVPPGSPYRFFTAVR